MKRIIRKITFAVILSIMCITSLFAFACSNSKKNEQDAPLLASADRRVYQGTHIVEVSDTDKEFVKDGKCDYTIVVPEQGNRMLYDANTDFQILFKKATGISLTSKRDNSVEDYSADKKYISIGQTKLVEQAGISKDEYSIANIKNEGIRIITKDNSIFILGGDDYGIANAVYKFMEIYFNYDFYYRNCIEIDTDVINMNFKSINVKDVPDINHFMSDINVYQYKKATQNLDSEGLGNETFAQEIAFKNMRSGMFASPMYTTLPIHKELSKSSKSAVIHNVMEYIDKTEENKEMFSDGAQLCYTAHGNPETLERMLNLCAEKIIFSLKTYTPDIEPYRNYVQLMMVDNSDICKCPACVHEYETINYSGSLLNFTNRLADKVGAWLESQKDENAEFHNAYREEFLIMLGAYNVYSDPPVDENGNPFKIKYQDGKIVLAADGEDLVARDNVGVWHVSARGFSSSVDVYDLSDSGAKAQIDGWQQILPAEHMWFWHNSGNVVNNIYFSDAFTVYSNNFFEALAGYDFVYSAHYYLGGGELTAWQNLLSYIQGKLRWDHTRDMDAYIKKYMNAMFLDGADYMYELLQSERQYYQTLLVKYGAEGKEYGPKNNDWGRTIKTKENYPYLTIANWLKICDDALKSIEYIKDVDNAKYQVVKHRINLEKAAHLYRILDLYQAEVPRPFNAETLKKYKNEIYQIGIVTPELKYMGKSLYTMGE